ncbi:hypothetical protein CLU79DRAFT_714785 [Phycomyces nitens]|nr:hypothetical protein CLU79DRAFT_714785 [Phycomyces nitens]
MTSVGGSLFPLLVVLLVLLVEMTEIKEGYRPTSKPIPKGGIQTMGKVPQSRDKDPLPSRFQKVESKPWTESHCQADSKEWDPNHGQSPTVKVTDPNNCMPAKFNTKYNAKFNAKSSAMFAVKSNVWLKCLVWKQSSMSSRISEFNAKFQVEFSTKVGFPSLIPSLLPEFDDKINAVPYESNYEFDSKKN